MKNKLLMAIFSMILLVGMINLSSAELFMWDNVIVDNSTNTVTHHGYYKIQHFDIDTSAIPISANSRLYPIDLSVLYTINPLPYNLSVGYADYCNLTITQFINQYETNGDFINLTTSTQTLNFGTNPSDVSGQVDFTLRDEDSLSIDLTCHHSTGANLYQDNVLVGRFSVLAPSFECESCEGRTLEETSKETETNLLVAEQEVSIYSRIQALIGLLFKIFVIITWFIKIGLLFGGVALIILSAYILYVFVNDLVKK